MLGCDFEIIYKKGKKNFVADALARKDEDVEVFLFAISIIQPDWITVGLMGPDPGSKLYEPTNETLNY